MDKQGLGRKWHALDIDSVFEYLRSGRSGLGAEDARNRLAEYGYNELPEKKKISPVGLFISQFKDYLVLILFAAAFISALTGETTNAYVILFIILFISILGFVQEYRAEKAMEALKKMVALEAKVLRNDTVRKTQARELVPGDIIYIEAGDRIPADARLIGAIDLETVESSLTGESNPVPKSAGVLGEDTPVAEQKNMVFMGTVVTRGRSTAIVVDTGTSTQIGRIAQMVQVKEEEPPLKVKFAVLSKQLARIVLIAAFIIFLVGSLRGRDIFDMLIVAAALAVAGIPESLPFITTATLALGTQRMAKRNAIIRKLPAVETLGSATVICSDKTGTITHGEMTVRRMYTDTFIEVTGNGYVPEGEFYRGGIKIDPALDLRLNELLRIGVTCNNSHLEQSGGWRVIGDPTEGALLVAAKKAGISEKYPRIAELPFDSERQRMSTVNNTPDGVKAFVKGAPEAVLKLCTYTCNDGTIMPLDRVNRNRILDATKEMTTDALRVLAFAERTFKDGECPEYAAECEEQKLTFVGLIGMIDPPREEVIEAIAQCKNASIKTVMITGDSKLTAKAVGRTIGLLDGEKILEGKDIDGMNDEELAEAAQFTAIYARATPEHKLRIVSALKRKGHIIAMTGDGVNDAPALRKADIGIAMGITGTDVAKEASDMIITDDNFATIVHAIEEGRRIYDNLRKSAVYLLSINFAEVSVLFAAVVILNFPVIPLLALQILFVNLVTEEFPALGLIVEPATEDIMRRPPRDPRENILTRRILLYTIGVTSTIFIGTLMLFIWTWYANPSIPLVERTALVQTTAFATLIVFGLFNALNSRSFEQSIFSIDLTANKSLLLALSGSVIAMMLAIYWQPMQGIFKTVALGADMWLKILLVSVSVIIAAEVLKRFLRDNI